MLFINEKSVCKNYVCDEHKSTITNVDCQIHHTNWYEGKNVFVYYNFLYFFLFFSCHHLLTIFRRRFILYFYIAKFSLYFYRKKYQLYLFIAVKFWLKKLIFQIRWTRKGKTRQEWNGVTCGELSCNVVCFDYVINSQLLRSRVCCITS